MEGNARLLRDLSNTFEGQSEVSQREMASETRCKHGVSSNKKAKEIWVVPQEKNRSQLASLSILGTVGSTGQASSSSSPKKKEPIDKGNSRIWTSILQ